MTDIEARRDPGPADSAEPGAASGALLSLRLPISVEIGSVELTMKEILDLKQSNVLALGVTDADPVRLIVNGIPVATGDLLSDGDRLTFRVKNVDSGGLDAGTLRAGGPKGGAA